MVVQFFFHITGIVDSHCFNFIFIILNGFSDKPKYNNKYHRNVFNNVGTDCTGSCKSNCHAYDYGHDCPCLIEMFQNAKICKLNQYRIYCMKYMQQAKQKLLYIENVFVNHSMIHLSNRTYLGPTFMFGISGCLVYAGQIIRYFLHWDFI